MTGGQSRRFETPATPTSPLYTDISLLENWPGYGNAGEKVNRPVQVPLLPPATVSSTPPPLSAQGSVDSDFCLDCPHSSSWSRHLPDKPTF